MFSHNSQMYYFWDFSKEQENNVSQCAVVECPRQTDFVPDFGLIESHSALYKSVYSRCRSISIYHSTQTSLKILYDSPNNTATHFGKIEQLANCILLILRTILGCNSFYLIMTSHLHHVWDKRCHFIFDYNSNISWSIFAIFHHWK